MPAQQAGGRGRAREASPAYRQGMPLDESASATNRSRLTTQAAEGSATTEGAAARRTLMNRHPNCAMQPEAAADAEVRYG